MGMTNKEITKWIDGWVTFFQTSMLNGWLLYELTLMYNQIEGSEGYRLGVMLKEATRVFSTALTRIVSNPRAPIAKTRLPKGLFCPDYPVPKAEKRSVQEVTNPNNDGLHVAGLFPIPPDCRLMRRGERLDEHFRDKRYIYVRDPFKLQRIHVERITKTPEEAVRYHLKSLQRRRFTTDDVLVLPKCESELSELRTVKWRDVSRNLNA